MARWATANSFSYPRRVKSTMSPVPAWPVRSPPALATSPFVDLYLERLDIGLQLEVRIAVLVRFPNHLAFERHPQR